GKNKTKRLRFRDARDRKMGREAYGDDGTIEHYFGSAYTKKGKEKGYTRGMGSKGSKARKFNTFYGFDIDEISLIRYLDPLTGVTLDEQPYTDIAIVQEHFGNIRQKMVLSDELDPQKIISEPGIQGFAIRDGAKKVLKLDLTPHNPLKVCDRFSTIAGFPERESELRQTGKAVEIDRSEIPKPSKAQVEYE
nr:VPg protein [Daphne mosaic virus]